MYKCSDFTKPVYKTGEIMEILNISYSTIKVYDKNGTLPISYMQEFPAMNKNKRETLNGRQCSCLKMCMTCITPSL